MREESSNDLQVVSEQLRNAAVERACRSRVRAMRALRRNLAVLSLRVVAVVTVSVAVRARAVLGSVGAVVLGATHAGAGGVGVRGTGVLVLLRGFLSFLVRAGEELLEVTAKERVPCH